ncbi:hypothetical protein [Solilutibacter silvestris]|uniref:hypothetical protein n=1 Tax=Solilutibacter silvestris TaxID=1645665 RepID=UPI003D333C5D
MDDKIEAGIPGQFKADMPAGLPLVNTRLSISVLPVQSVTWKVNVCPAAVKYVAGLEPLMVTVVAFCASA